MGAGPDRKLTGIQRAWAARAAVALEEEAAVRATTLAKFAKSWAAALILAVALAASGAAFAQSSNGGGGSVGHAAAPSAPSGPSGSGGHGPGVALGGEAGSCDVGPSLPTLPTFGEAGDDVKALSRATESYIRNCGCATQACVADALDKYAEALAKVTPRLPPQLQDEANVVAQAARRVRAARTKAEALHALNDAIAIIHKDVELVKAEDPDHPRLTRGGDFVAETLNVASLALEKGGGL
jgi:hypothetical protein